MTTAKLHPALEENKMLCKGIIGTIYKIGIWNVIQMKYFIDVKFPEYGNYGYMKEYSYFQKIHSEVKEQGVCNLFSNGSEKIKIECVSVAVMCTNTHPHREKNDAIVEKW